MRRIPLSIASLGVLIAAAACDRGGETQARAEENLRITGGWCQATPQGAKTGACFLTLQNNSAEDERLTGATTGAAGEVQIHETYTDGNVLRMRPVEALAVPARQAVELRPGGYNLRLIGLTNPLVVGATVPVTLRFSRAGEQQLLFPVRVEAPPASE